MKSKNYEDSPIGKIHSNTSTFAVETGLATNTYRGKRLCVCCPSPVAPDMDTDICILKDTEEKTNII